ncbi:emp24/gp25L/p24 family/GOLD-domain-containing protein [Protomyces lactucae-debilis]|uniref:Emp24/gp25L/p24 family/GOLD-domain-containing protein n=1 Tax=Protomyces lactucae-debilis TaxID=2754530 RepID=A0A1Y2F504_PROLT|nr:emp24/gp25L/p24 family/GOLD-domain-containing protein [Protomyces lactucae-debilis]ORY78949.1 emp24/gp25L/p24 family/GOLD-domain-containing protein [Protomyces lactucae-debilis]
MLKALTLVAAAVIALLGHAVDAGSPITYRVKSNENACFYTNVDKAGEKISFYFAVQAGGDFDIDYYVRTPTFQLVLEGTKERSGDFVFTATETGEYTFCFNNNMSTVTDKVVDFEINVESEPRPELPTKQGIPSEATNGLEDSVFKVSSQVSQLSRTQKYFRTREHRNMSTVQSTEHRIFWFALLESGAMVTMSALQVFIVRTFFQRRNAAKV